jgi:hypothetical protein
MTKEEKKAYRAKYYQDNKEEHDRRSKEWYRNNADKKKEISARYAATHADHIKSRRLELKRICIEHYGVDSGCVCCGTKELSFLSLDHIKDDATEDKKRRGGIKNLQYRTIVKDGFPIGLQTLCFNCQWGKRINGGFCPHNPAKDLRIP